MNILEQFSKRAAGPGSESGAGFGVHNIVVFKNRRQIARCDWDEEIRRNLYSASKSVTSAAVGVAVKEGLLSLSEPLTEIFSRELPEAPCDNLRALTVKELLTMQMGQERPLLMGGERTFMENSFRCDGKYGQYAIMFPEKNALIALTAECREQRKLLACIFDTIVPLL
jgi:hypothetical protein